MKVRNLMNIAAHTFNPCAGEAKAHDLCVWDQPGLHSELQDNKRYRVRSCINKTKQDKTKGET